MKGMTREMAKLIIDTQLRAESVSIKRLEILEELDLMSWDKACTEAMKFLIGVQNADTRTDK